MSGNAERMPVEAMARALRKYPTLSAEVRTAIADRLCAQANRVRELEARLESRNKHLSEREERVRDALKTLLGFIEDCN